MIVQNAETMGVREGKTRSIRSFHAPKKHFYGCDGSSWGFMPDGTVMVLLTLR